MRLIVYINTSDLCRLWNGWRYGAIKRRRRLIESRGARSRRVCAIALHCRHTLRCRLYLRRKWQSTWRDRLKAIPRRQRHKWSQINYTCRFYGHSEIIWFSDNSHMLITRVDYLLLGPYCAHLQKYTRLHDAMTNAIRIYAYHHHHAACAYTYDAQL